MTKITGKDAMNGWCVYTLHDDQGNLVFIYYGKVASAMSLRDLISNPAFDQNKQYTFTVQTIYPSQREAMSAQNAYIQTFGTPSLNKTVLWNRKTQVRCIETGQVWRNQLECAKSLGLNQSQLSQHLRRNPGFKSIKGMHFENVADTRAIQTVRYP